MIIDRNKKPSQRLPQFAQAFLMFVENSSLYARSIETRQVMQILAKMLKQNHATLHNMGQCNTKKQRRKLRELCDLITQELPDLERELTKVSQAIERNAMSVACEVLSSTNAFSPSQSQRRS